MSFLHYSSLNNLDLRRMLRMFNSVYHANAILQAVGIAAVALLAGCQHDKMPVEEGPEIRPVRVEKTITRRLEEEHQYAGAIQARYETQLAFRVGGKVIARQVEVGDLVKLGDELMRLDSGGQELVVQSLKAQLAGAQADLDQAKAELNRYKDLLRRKVISSSEYERHETVYDTALARYEQVKSQLAEAELQSGYAILRADRAGVITDVLVEVGQVVAAGQPVLNLALPEEKEVIVHIPENRLAEFNHVDQVRISL